MLDEGFESQSVLKYGKGEGMYPDVEVTDEEELFFERLAQQQLEELYFEEMFSNYVPQGGTKQVVGGVVHY